MEAGREVDDALNSYIENLVGGENAATPAGDGGWAVGGASPGLSSARAPLSAAARPFAPKRSAPKPGAASGTGPTAREAPWSGWNQPAASHAGDAGGAGGEPKSVSMADQVLLRQMKQKLHWVPARVVEDNLPALRARDRGALESILERYPRPTSARQRPQPWKAAVAASSPAGAAPASTQAGTAGPRRGRQVGGAPTGAAAPSAAAVAGHSTHYRDQNAINADALARVFKHRRGEAERLARERARALEQSQQAYRIGDGGRARQLSQLAQDLGNRMYREHEAAAEAVFRFRNPDPGALDVVDLHGLLPWEVEGFLVDHMARVREAPRPPDAVSVLVGVGRHQQAYHRFGKSRAKGEGSKLEAAAIEVADSRGWQRRDGEPGEIVLKPERSW